MKWDWQWFSARAGSVRKKHGLTMEESCWCVLWLAGVKEPHLPKLAARLMEYKVEESKRKYGQ